MSTLFAKLRLPYRDDPFFSSLTLLLLVVPTIFFIYSYEKFDTVKYALWFVLFGAALLALCFSRSGSDYPSGRWQVRFSWPLTIFLAALVLLSVVSSVFSLDKNFSWFGFYPRFFNGLLFQSLFLATVPLVLFRLTRSRLEFLLKVLVATALAGSVVAILQSLGIGFYEGVSDAAVHRAPGLLGNANFSSLFLVTCLPLELYFLLASQSKKARWYYGAALLLSVAATILLSSRGAWLGLVLVIFGIPAALVFHKFSWKKVAGAVVAGAAVLVFMLASSGIVRPQALRQTLTLQETNVNLRFFVWDIARQTITDRPWFGVGPGNFQLAFETQRSKALANQRGVYDDAHNFFLQLAATEGLPFLLLFLCLLATALFYGLRQARRENDLLGSMLSLSTLGLLSIALFTPVSSACLLLLAVLLAGLYFFSSRPVALHNTGVFKTALAVVAAAAVLWGATFLVGEAIFYRGFVQYLSGQYEPALESLQLSVRLGPWSQIRQVYAAAAAAKLYKNPTQTRQAVERFVSLHRGDSRSYRSAGAVMFELYDATRQREHLQEAIGYMQEALKRDRNLGQLYIQTALYMFAANRLQESLAYAQYGLSLDQDFVPGWLLVARLYQLENRKEPALFALEKAAVLHPEVPALGYLLKAAKEYPDFQKIEIPVVLGQAQLE